MVVFGDVVLLIMLGVTAVAIVRLQNLFGAVMLSGIYSLLSAGLFVVMDAVDVAFTEAAVGAGISTVLMLGTLALVGHEEHKPQHRPILPLFVVTLTGAILIYGTVDLPPFGSPDNPVHHHVADHYLEESYEEMGGIPNVVTSVLASYRGYDTMGETTVIFTAVVGVLLLLSRGPRPRRLFRDGRWITLGADAPDPAVAEAVTETGQEGERATRVAPDGGGDHG
jgi:multicomponent Na+:H+ antiporter subunit B